MMVTTLFIGCFFLVLSVVIQSRTFLYGHLYNTLIRLTSLTDSSLGPKEGKIHIKSTSVITDISTIQTLSLVPSVGVTWGLLLDVSSLLRFVRVHDKQSCIKGSKISRLLGLHLARISIFVWVSVEKGFRFRAPRQKLWGSSTPKSAPLGPWKLLHQYLILKFLSLIIQDKANEQYFLVEHFICTCTNY